MIRMFLGLLMRKSDKVRARLQKFPNRFGIFLGFRKYAVSDPPSHTNRNSPLVF